MRILSGHLSRPREGSLDQGCCRLRLLMLLLRLHGFPDRRVVVRPARATAPFPAESLRGIHDIVTGPVERGRLSTIVFALPAPVRLTYLARVSVVLAGATECIILSLSMVVIAALVGAQGLVERVVRAPVGRPGHGEVARAVAGDMLLWTSLPFARRATRPSCTRRERAARGRHRRVGDPACPRPRRRAEGGGGAQGSR